MLRTQDKRLLLGGLLPDNLANRRPMPVLFGAGGGVEAIVATAQAGRAASVTGDIELCVIETSNGQPGTISTAGWAQVPNSPQDAADTCLAVWWHYFTVGDGLPTINDAGDHMVSYMHAVRGCNPNPFEVTAGQTAAASSTVTFPAITTVSWNTCVVYIVSIGRDANSTDIGTSPASAAQAFATVTGGSQTIPVSNVFGRISTVGNGGGYWIGAAYKEKPGPMGTPALSLATSQAQGQIVLAMR